MSSDTNKNKNDKEPRKRKRRWGDVTDTTTTTTTNNNNNGDLPPPPPPPVDGKTKALALQDSIRARLAALKGKTAAATATTATSTAAPLPAKKRAKHYELDLTVTAPTFQETPLPPKPKVNPYLQHKEEPPEEESTTATTTTTATTIVMDDRLGRANKERKRHKSLQFVTPGTFIEMAQRKRLKAANAEQSGFVSGRKTGQFVKATNMASVYGASSILHDKDDDDDLPPLFSEKKGMTTPLVMEWWDLELLPTKLKKQVIQQEGKVLLETTHVGQLEAFAANTSTTKQPPGTTTTTTTTPNNNDDDDVFQLQTRCYEQASLSYCKTATLIQHIVPITNGRNTNDDETKMEPTLYLTKKELKRQRKLRRQEKQRELQDLQAAGLVPPPEPRLTLGNFIRVLGDQAFVDPSQMEQKVMEQIQARQRAHMERNNANKLSKEQRSEKRARKLHEDTSKGVHVALFYVKDMSHPYHRTKVDLNAQQYNITGGVLECPPHLSCVIVEGGPKAIKKYIRLMLVRMKWQGTGLEDGDDEEEEEEEDAAKEKEPNTNDDDEEEEVVRHKFNPHNKCELVWTGMAVKRFFKGFVFQACESSYQARNILKAKGVGHYWDQVVAHASGTGENIPLKLASASASDDEDDDDGEEKDNGRHYGPVGSDHGNDAKEVPPQEDVEMQDT